MKAIVILLNRSLQGFDAPQYVQGLNQEQIGISKFDTRYGCHSLTLSLEDYEKYATSIAGCSHLAMRRWEVHFVPDVAPDAVKQFADGYALGIDGAPEPAGMTGHFEYGFTAGLFEHAAAEAQKKRAADESEQKRLEEELKASELVFKQKPSIPEIPVVNPLITGSGDYANAVKAMTPAREPGADFPEVAIHNTDLNVPFFKLNKIAKEEGVDLTGCEGVQQIRAAIAKHRLQPA